MIVALHIGHDIMDLICLDVRVLPIGSGVACSLTILLVVHCDNDKRLCLSLCDQVVQNIGHVALIHPAQLVTIDITGRTMRQIQHFIRLCAVRIIIRWQIHGQTMLRAVCPDVRNGLYRSALACIRLRQFHRAVCPLTGALLGRIIRDIDHTGQTVDPRCRVGHRRIDGIVQPRDLIAIRCSHTEVIDERAA